jgi:TDG/mug DNA glycosylase family protein
METSDSSSEKPLQTLPDYLKPGLKLLFIGINPGYYSAQVGHYYARPGNLFWWALSNSGLLPHAVTAQEDATLLNWNIGLTDVVKRPTHSSGDLRQNEFDEGAKVLAEKIERYQPEVACFVGLLGATAYLGRHIRPGLQSEKMMRTHIFAIPSPSRRNAHYGKDGILGFFKDLARFVGGPKDVKPKGPVPFPEERVF